MTFRVGTGFDVHRFDSERELWLGGILIEGHPGLLGHSDADVMIHALIDALLGAAGFGDIGEMFPDTDDSLKGIRSTILLQKVADRLYLEGWQIVNIDSVIVCETPKILPHRNQMRQTISEILKIDIGRIMIKGKTSEKLGFTGRGEGVFSNVVVLLEQRRSN
jgi:2-C-methyl-D-erythritol 2,4-cyclodiphosphate synthase